MTLRDGKVYELFVYDDTPGCSGWENNGLYATKASAEKRYKSLCVAGVYEHAAEYKVEERIVR